MTSLLIKAFRYNWNAHASNPVNLWSALLTMIVNNILFLYGMWLMIFDGKENNQRIFPYYIAMTVLAYIGWGSLNFFVGGLRMMGDIIDNGRLEPMLGTPRSSLLLIAISESQATALGDLIQGLISLIWLFWLTDLAFVVRTALSSFFVIIGFASIFIFSGTLVFFLQRGSSLSTFIIESTLTFSMYPSTKTLEGNSRKLLYVLPAVLTVTLPMVWIESANIENFLIMFLVSIIAFIMSVIFFNKGIKRYRSANYISVRN